MLLAAMCMCLGYLVAFTVHESSGASHIAANSSTLRKVHVWAGYSVIAATLGQIMVGVYKYIVRTRDNAKFATWHGKAGPAIWAASLVVVALGVEIVWGSNGYTGTAVGLWVLLAAVLGLGLLELLTGPAAAMDDYSAAPHKRSDDGTSAGGGPGGGYGVRSSLGSLNNKLLV
jgi:hypothetical protein